MHNYTNALYCQFLVFCGQSFETMSFQRLDEFCSQQWPIVERALVQDEGVQACTAASHDLTCAFVARRLFEAAVN